MNLCECEKLNPLKRDGTSQTQRLLDMLKHDYFLIDERKLDDLILFAYRYADYIKFYDSNVAKDEIENWAAFIKCDITTVISLIANVDHKELMTVFEKRKKNLYDKIQKSDTNTIEITEVKNILDDIYKLAETIDEWYKQSVKEISLKQDLEIIIQSSLSSALNNLIGLKGIKNSNEINLTSVDEESFHDIWQVDTFYEYKTYSFNLDKSELANLLNDIDAIFKEYYNSLKKLNNSVSKYFNEALKKYPYHQPHFALFLAFLQLFKYAQDHINKLTKSHLDFYYKDFLQLKQKAAQSDTVYLIFELAKNVSSYAVKKDTLLKAGKDDTSVDIFYGTNKEIVVNNSEVASLKTVYLDKYDTDSIDVTKIYSAPTANSKDGNGTDFDNDDKKWKTFGESQSGKQENETTMLDASMGFAIASPQFFLSEGTRKITITFEFEDEGYSEKNLKKTLTKESLKFYFSGAKKWVEASLYDEIKAEDNKIILPLLIDQDQPSIEKYNSKKLGAAFVTDWPVLKVLLVQEYNPYEYLKSLDISLIKINTDVDGVTNLIIQNDVGLLDSSKPFMPFGPIPVKGSGFYIGSSEIFNKEVCDLDIYLEWMDLETNFASYYAGYGSNNIPENNNDYKVNTYFREDYKWNKIELNKILFTEPTEPEKNDGKEVENEETDTRSKYESLKFSFTGIKSEKEREEFTQFSNSLKKGFIKLELSGRDFNHKIYSKILTENAINKATGTTNGDTTIINTPYTPLIKTIKLDYKAESKFDSNIDQLFQLHPFGFVETTFESADDKEEESTETSSTSTSYPKVKTAKLLPAFVYDDIVQEGLLYIGIKDLVPPQNLNLLFQIAEGSGDLSVKALEKIYWSYLSKNEWKNFDSQDIIADTTNNLKTTGIIEFDISKDATKNNTLLDSSYYWLRASVPENTKGVNQLIDVKAQAVAASFRDNKNDPAYLSEALEAETITKLATRVPQIKSVAQPYASFGGKVKEQSEEFYRRVSERLRHKNRPINIWDYERLILENFPSIYKVKCLNHTGTESEISPGYVTVIPISNLRNKNAIDKLKPSTSIDTLDQIKKFLTDLISPGIKVEVENPLYEEIRVSFYVQFNEGIDKGYYAQKLQEEIIKFLSPWAFAEGNDILFGGKIHSSYIINFIEERSYVDYLTDFKLFHYVEKNKPKQSEEAVASTSKSILVSYSDHRVEILE